MNRGYSWLNVRSVDEEKRVIEGIATTPTQARDGDILETSGIQFKLPLPFLWRHKDPMGNVMGASVGPEGIAVRIQVGAPGISQAIDEQWAMVKHGIVRGLSIGWRTLEETFDKKINGYRITKSEWLELSAVPVPADANATITSIRSADEEALAALGRDGHRAAERGNRSKPGVSGSHSNRGVKMAKSFEEKIRDLENRRKPIQERMTTVMELKENESREFTKEEATSFDADSTEMEQIDTDLKRLRAYQDAVGTARPVPREVSEGAVDHSRSRVEVKKVELPKGTQMARAVIALINARGSHYSAAELATRYYKDTPEVAMYLRAVVDAGDTTTSGWASQLVPAAQMQSDFLDMLRPATLVGRMAGLRHVPFNVSVALQSGAGTYGWVGESAPKPVTKLTVASATLRWAKIAGIIVITKELAKFSSPSAEAIIRNDMIKGVAAYIDAQFCDPAVAAVSNVSPASITNGISPLTPTGITANDLRYDIGRLMAQFITDNQDPTNATLLMNPSTASSAALMLNSLGQPEFPGMTVAGGSIAGIPVLVSSAVGTRIILVNASEILFADDGGVSIDVSEQATIEMNTAPIGPEESPLTGAVLHSLWQRNEIGLRVERFITWLRARDSAVGFIATPAYVPTHT